MLISVCISILLFAVHPRRFAPPPPAGDMFHRAFGYPSPAGICFTLRSAIPRQRGICFTLRSAFPRQRGICFTLRSAIPRQRGICFTLRSAFPRRGEPLLRGLRSSRLRRFAIPRWRGWREAPGVDLPTGKTFANCNCRLPSKLLLLAGIIRFSSP